MLLEPGRFPDIRSHGVSRFDRFIAFFSRAADAAIIFAALYLVVMSSTGMFDSKYGLTALLGATIFVLFGEITGIYRPWRGESLTRQFFQITFAWSESLFVLALTAYAFEVTSDYSRGMIGVWILATPFALSAWRMLWRKFLESAAETGGLVRNAVVWGSGKTGRDFVQTIRQSPWLGLNIVKRPVELVFAPVRRSLPGHAEALVFGIDCQEKAQSRRRRSISTVMQLMQ